MIHPDTHPNPNIHSLPVKVLAATLVAVGALSISGCAEAKPDPDKQLEAKITSIRESGNVVSLDNAMPTLADEIANSLMATNHFQDSLHTQTDRAQLETEAKSKGLLAADKLIAAMQANEYETLVLSSVTSTDVTLFDAAKAEIELAKISDADVRRTMHDYTDLKVTTSALNAVRFGSIEPLQAKEILDELKPANHDEAMSLLEPLDAGSNVIDNYKSADGVRKDASDITDPTLRKLLEEEAKSIENDSRKHKAREKILTLYDQATAMVDAMDEDENDVYRAYRRAADGEGAEIEFQSAIAKHNAIASVDSFNGLRELTDPGRVIDLRGVKGPKVYVNQLKSSKEIEHEFAEVYAEGGKPVIKFAEGNGLTQEAINQLTQLTEDVMPMIASGMQKGDIVAIRFVIGDNGAYNPYFHPSSREIHMVLPTDDSMSEDQFRTGLVHELTHALVASAFSIEGQVTDEEAGQVKNSCRALSTQAYELFEKRSKESSLLLDSLITTAKTEEDKKVFIELKKIIDEGKVTDVMAEASFSDSSINKYDLDNTMCAADETNFGDLVDQAALNADIKDWQNVRSDLSDRYIKNYKDANGKEATSDLGKLIDVWIDATEKYSLWSKLNESAFVDTDSWVKEYLGHSADNATEMMATVTDVTLHKPEQIVEMMKSLNPTDREAVKSSILASYTILGNRHPQLRQYLNRRYEFFEAVS